MNESPSPVAQWIFNMLVGVSGAAGTAQKAGLLGRLRGWMARWGDPLVTWRLEGVELLLPFSHNLPIYRKLYPDYSAAVGRIVAQVKCKYPDLTFIDIGANVGDTVVILRSAAYLPILCIEGNDRFFALLQRNVASMQDIYLEHTFVGSTTGTVKGTVDWRPGTSRLVKDENSAERVQTNTLSDILKGQPRFAQAKMIKLDTDGFDCRILQSELDWLSQSRPVIMFEYDPHYFKQQGDNGLETLERLSEIGYQAILVYENSGEYLLTADLDNHSLLQDLDHFYSGRGGSRYCDICAFHRDDASLALTMRQAEIEYFNQRRRVSSRGKS